MLTEAAIVSHAAKVRDDGFTVIEGAASADLVEGLKQAVERIEREHNLGPAGKRPTSRKPGWPRLRSLN